MLIGPHGSSGWPVATEEFLVSKQLLMCSSGRLDLLLSLGIGKSCLNALNGFWESPQANFPHALHRGRSNAQTVILALDLSLYKAHGLTSKLIAYRAG